VTRISPGQQRKLQRIAHLAAGVLILGYVYLPVPVHLDATVRLVVVPLLVVSGVAMWQAARLRRLTKAFAPHRRG
jgi:hypothetical protein